MQGIFQKENTDKSLKYGIYRHLPTYEKIIRNLVSFFYKNIENHDSVLLLQDCIAGCKMALESMDDIREHTDDKQLRELIDKYYDEHTGLSVDCRDMLDKAGADIKEPGVFAKMAAKLQTAMKMAVNDDQSQAAKLLTEGCNMGIETISGSLNEYRDADSKSVAIAERLRTLEEKMVGDLQPLL